MKLIKGFVIAVLGLFVFITLFSLLIPSTVMTVRSVTINAPADKVFAQISDLQNWKHWHPVFKKDSTGIKISTPSTGRNAYAEWNTNGKTNTILIDSLLSNHIKASLKRTGEKDVENIISVFEIPESNSMEVEWRALTRLKWYPWEKFSGIFTDKITGPGYEAALEELKKYVEQ